MRKRHASPFSHTHWMADRHGGERCLLRVPGRKAVTLKGWNSRLKAEASTIFAAQYREALAGAEPIERKGLGVPRSGTIAALRAITYKHVLFTGKRPATQRTLRSYIDRMAALEGDKPWALLRPEDVQRRVNIFAAAGKAAAARNFKIAVTLLHKVAVDVGWRKKGDDPTRGVELPKIKGKGYRTWTDDEAAAYETAYGYDTRERLIYEAYACTALRRSDIARLCRGHIRTRKQIACIGQHKVTHNLVLPWIEKNDEPLTLPILPWLQRALDELPADNVPWIMTTDDGRPLIAGPDGKALSGKRTADVLSEACLKIGLGRKIVDASGVPKGLSGHGLRKRMATRLAELCGCSELKIMAVLGQRDPRSAKVYTAAANNRMAEDALFELLALVDEEQPGTTGSHTPAPASHTLPQPFESKGK
jgi:integrase